MGGPIVKVPQRLPVASGGESGWQSRQDFLRTLICRSRPLRAERSPFFRPASVFAELGGGPSRRGGLGSGPLFLVNHQRAILDACSFSIFGPRAGRFAGARS